MYAGLTFTSNVIATIGTVIGILGAVLVVMRFLIHNATDPIASKVADHDTQIAHAIELGNSTNIKVSRIEGFMAGRGTTKLPEVEPTLEKPVDGTIIQVPLLKE